MPNPSPLRYPGGKSRLSDFVGMMINNIGISNCTYVEPFAGGAGVAISLDATLYGFSQGKLVEYLWKAAGDYKIQIIFTTHSPVILKCVNKYYRKERQEKGIKYDESVKIPFGAFIIKGLYGTNKWLRYI